MSQNNNLVDVSKLYVHFPIFGGIFSKTLKIIKSKKNTGASCCDYDTHQFSPTNATRVQTRG